VRKGTHTIDQALVLFGRPASVTGFLRSNRGAESDIDDTYTIILQYSGEQKNLLVTIKTAIVTHMKDQLRFFVRGTKGTYLKAPSPFPKSEVYLAPKANCSPVWNLSTRSQSHSCTGPARHRGRFWPRGGEHVGHTDYHYRVRFSVPELGRAGQAIRRQVPESSGMVQGIL